MTAKQQAIKDIKDDLMQENRCFLAFNNSLNPVMDRLVRDQIEQQQCLFKAPFKANTQLVARCFYHKSDNIKYENYEKYYETER